MTDFLFWTKLSATFVGKIILGAVIILIFSVGLITTAGIAWIVIVDEPDPPCSGNGYILAGRCEYQ